MIYYFQNKERTVFTVNKTLPPMLDKPEGRTIGSGLSYWSLAFLLFPLMIALFSSDEGQVLFGDKMDLVYHLVNFIAAVATFLPYLKESFLEVQINTKKFLVTTMICAGAIVLFKLVICKLVYFIPDLLWVNAAFGCLLTTESDMAFYSVALLEAQPLLGLLCVTLLTPVTVSCLLYACVFAPVCNNRPWLAYILVSVAFLVIQLLKVFGLWSWEQQMANFCVLLPVHLIACLAYQITDTVWAPIAVHSLSNLGASVIYHLFVNHISTQ